MADFLGNVEQLGVPLYQQDRGEAMLDWSTVNGVRVLEGEVR